jgi:hypothetical protein
MNMEKIKVRVVKPVEGRKIGDEFECYPNEVKFQVKHKSIEVIEDEQDDGDMTVPEIKEKLTAAGIEFPAGAKKSDLLALLSQ